MNKTTATGLRVVIFIQMLVAVSLLLSATSELGDRFALSTDYADKTVREVDQTFGATFGEQLVAAPVGEWSGPLESAYGLHLVRVLARTEPRLPDFDELRERLSNDYSFETRRAANELALERLTERYQIVFAPENG